MAGHAHALGEDVEIFCRFCRVNLDAVVSAVVNGEIAKVQCRTCRHFQDYRPPVTESERRRKLLQKVIRMRDKRTSSQVRSSPVDNSLSAEAVVRRMWDEATKDANPLKSKVYDVHRVYGMDDMITHREMGLGVVREVAEDGTVAVLFKDGYKRLPHGRPRDEEE